MKNYTYAYIDLDKLHPSHKWGTFYDHWFCNECCVLIDPCDRQGPGTIEIVESECGGKDSIVAVDYGTAGKQYIRIEKKP